MALLDTFINSSLVINKDPKKYSQVSQLDNRSPGASLLDMDNKQPSTYSKVSRLDNIKESSSQLNRDETLKYTPGDKIYKVNDN